MNTVRPSLGSSHLSDDPCDGHEQIVRVSPDVDVTSPPFFGQRNADQAVGSTKFETGNERRGTFRGCDRLLVFEPMADAPAEEFRETRQLCLVSAKPRLEVPCLGSFMLEQTVKRQPAIGYRHDDRGSGWEREPRGIGKRHGRSCYDASPKTLSRGWRRDTICETPSGPIVTP